MARAEISVATFEQLATVLAKTATNYTNMSVNFYDMFYNDTPMDITLQIFAEDGSLMEVTVPNRAKDRAYILNGNGSPDGKVSAKTGTLYQDLVNGTLFIKTYGSSVNGWTKVAIKSELEETILQGNGSPEGILVKPRGTIYIDLVQAIIYIKATATGNSGWEAVNASSVNYSTIDLDNLSAVGEAHFANPSLDNLNSRGRAIIEGKQDVIADLDEIRAGAKLGKTSLQPNSNISLLNNDAKYVNEAQLNTKQNVLAAGDSISISNNKISVNRTQLYKTYTQDAWDKMTQAQKDAVDLAFIYE